MKVFANGKVYVQNNDLQYLLRVCDSISISSSITNKVFGDGISIPLSIINKIFGDFFIVTDGNRYKFVEFSNPEDVEFFRNCDWIIDYHAFDGRAEEEIINFGIQINDNRNKLVEEFNNLPEKEQEKQYEQVSSEVMMLDHKINSIIDLVWYRQGHLMFTVPTEIEVEHTVSEANELPSKENIFQRVLKQIKELNKKD